MQIEEKDEKSVTIIVNAQEKVVTAKVLTFDQVVELAFPGGPKGGDWVYTVTFRKAHGDKPEGTLVQGDTVKVKKGTIFNVTQTNKS